MTNVYEVSSEYEVLQESDPDEIEEKLKMFTSEVLNHSVGLATVAKNLQCIVDEIKIAEKNMEHRRIMLERKVGHIKDFIKFNLEAVHLKRVDSAYLQILVKNNPPKILIDNYSAIPKEYLTPIAPVEPPPNKKKIMDSIKNGVDVPGAFVIFETRLEIK